MNTLNEPRFDERILYAPDSDVPVLFPSHTVDFDVDFAGQWLVCADLDGDGRAELVTARNDHQAITAMSAWRLDGTCLWTWGEPGAGSPVRTYDVPLQLYDIDGDGQVEVVYGVHGKLVVAEGASGRTLWEWPLPPGLEVADCITFARLTSTEGPADILVKTRYTKVWAFDPEWRCLWSWEPAGNYKTCHHPTVFDVDGDGLDEIMAGYVLLGPDGGERWTYNTNAVDLSHGHLDCCWVAETGTSPEAFRLVVTACGADHVALLDGTGRMLWEHAGHHFESAETGRLRPESAWDVVVDIDHRPYGESPMWVIGADGAQLGSYMTNYSRFHHLVDIDGDGFDEILMAHARTLCDASGRRRYQFAPDDDFAAAAVDPLDGDTGPFAVTGDMTGDGRIDIVAHTERRAHVYENQGHLTEPAMDVGTPVNFTLY